MDDETLEDDNNGYAPVISTDPIVVTTYSTRATNALRTAEMTASTFPGGVMTSEHLLQSICHDPECAASQVLASCGFAPPQVIDAMAFVGGPEPAGEPAVTVVLSPRVERILTGAGLEAGNRAADCVDTLHLLIAMLREGRGIAALVLETPGVGHEPIGAALSRAIRNGLTDPS